MDSSVCRECGVGLEEGDNWYPSDARNYHYICTSCRAKKRAARRERDYASVIVSRVKYRALKRGIPFDITSADIRIPNYCPVLGIKIQPGEAGGRSSSPSLDRINPDKGYVPGNVQVISNRANTLKNNATPEELRAVADHLQEIERRDNAAY